ncbi:MULTISPECIES: MerR family transcriptional regulator [Mesobacillus]|uniref:Chromosome-anchoring protein RacA n=1 Tax=Mesobacillus selenatarsenatis TaxID=388741 RepID=A0A846TAX6_9BACI|nr:MULTISPECIES: MerR family transcriptional regulator [Mesobacillus]NKE06168.1 MerR family transcriptional regulator [Mesobacillus selenatarsenatis]
MNTSAVAKLLGVSPSTIQRWVKQANLQMERTELGHYQFSEESIEVLKDIKDQLNSGVLLQDLKVKGRKHRKATIPAVKPDLPMGKLMKRMEEIEKRLDRKADEVVSYQLLQHRREIEELQKEVARLTEVITSMEEAAAQRETVTQEANKLSLTPGHTLKKFKKRNIISSFFGF